MSDDDGYWDWDYNDAIHRYQPDDTGRCTGGWYNRNGEWVNCHSTQRSSTLHDDPAADFRQMHDHGGGDCMCFESEDGPSYWEAERAYVEGRINPDNGAGAAYFVLLKISTYEAKPPDEWDWKSLLDLGPYEKVEVKAVGPA